jgi:hypothetical protein
MVIGEDFERYKNMDNLVDGSIVIKVRIELVDPPSNIPIISSRTSIVQDYSGRVHG